MHRNEQSAMSLRAITGRGVLRVRQDGKTAFLRGYAALYNSLSEDLGGFREQIAPGAFTETLATNPDVRALVNHDPNLLLGRTTTGTLRLRADARGLLMEVALAPTSYARDLAIMADRGDINQMSFAFRVPRDGDVWEETADGILRTLTRIELADGDVSVVTYPAYPATRVSLVGVRDDNLHPVGDIPGADDLDDDGGGAADDDDLATSGRYRSILDDARRRITARVDDARRRDELLINSLR